MTLLPLCILDAGGLLHFTAQVSLPTSPSPGVAKFLKDSYFVCGIHPAAQSVVIKQCGSGIALGNVYNVVVDQGKSGSTFVM